MKIRKTEEMMQHKFAMIDQLIKEGVLEDEACCMEGGGPLEKGLGVGEDAGPHCEMKGKDSHMPGGDGDGVIIKLRGNPEIINEILEDIMDKVGVDTEGLEKIVNKKDNIEDFDNLFDDDEEDNEEANCPGDKIRSDGKGRGMGVGRGKGPIGIPGGGIKN